MAMLNAEDEALEDGPYQNQKEANHQPGKSQVNGDSSEVKLIQGPSSSKISCSWV
jgi:hypothetical protein